MPQMVRITRRSPLRTGWPAENTASGSYDTSSIKIDGKPLSEYTDAAIIYNADGKGFTITGLPPLGYNQSYELTYDVTVGAVTGADGSGTLVNTAKSTTNTLQSNEAKDTVTVKESSITKAGTYDAATHRINWVITVKNPGGDLAGYTVTDTQVTQLDIVGDVTLKRADETVVTTITGNDFLTNGYTFPAGSNASSYTFTYQTVAPDPGEWHRFCNQPGNAGKRFTFLYRDSQCFHRCRQSGYSKVSGHCHAAGKR